jgi:parallel beta-helix repeat protein
MKARADDRVKRLKERSIATMHLLGKWGLAGLLLATVLPVGPQANSQEPPPPRTYVLAREGSTYRATLQGVGSTYAGTLKQVMESAARDLHGAGGGTMTFSDGVFDFGGDRFVGSDFANITFEGAGMDITVLQNNSSAAADTEPFDMHNSNGITIRDMTVNAGGSFRSTSDAIDFDGGNNVLIERVRVTGSRSKGLMFDGKDVRGAPRTADHNVIRDCIITGVPSDGIEFLSARDNRVEGCTIEGVGGHGIQITKSSPTANQPNKKSDGNVLSENLVEDSGQDGINIMSGDRNEVLGNTILNSSDDMSGRDGIRITSSDSITCDDNVLSGNTIGDDQTEASQSYGIHIASSACSRTVVGDNILFGNRRGGINDRGTDTQYPPPGSDNESPTHPSHLTATPVSPNRVDLAWGASTDDVGVAGYEIFRDGSSLATVGADTAYSDTTVLPSTTYQYGARARDEAGNLSGFGNIVAVTTPGAGVPLFSDEFETGDFSQWTKNTGLVAQQEEVRNGSWASRATTVSPAVWAYKQLDADHVELYYRIRFKIVQTSSSTLNVVKLRTSAGTSMLGIYRSSTGKLGYRNDIAGVSIGSSTPVPIGVWHEVQVRVRVDGASGETETWFDGARIAALSKTENLGTTPIGRIQVGDNSSGRSYDMAFDDVVASTGFLAY